MYALWGKERNDFTPFYGMPHHKKNGFGYSLELSVGGLDRRKRG